MATRATSPATVTMVVEQKLPGGARYTGRLVNNKRDGRGTWTGTTGEAYDGHWCDDSLHGRGRYTWPSGDANDGEWHAGKRDGWGEHRHADGGRFEGLWRDGSWKRGAWHSKNGVGVLCRNRYGPFCGRARYILFFQPHCRLKLRHQSITLQASQLLSPSRSGLQGTRNNISLPLLCSRPPHCRLSTYIWQWWVRQLIVRHS
ncbi:hypothetical protein Pelo_15083 [Pelomyxa schiedti]|nr:hypothetical protein Pelo_15083 [Pelomyxa schiedti]